MSTQANKSYASNIELAKSLQEKLGVKKKDARQIITSFKEAVIELVGEKKELRIDGFGTFRLSKRSERMGMNPRTGEKVKIPAMTVATFRMGKKFRESVASK